MKVLITGGAGFIGCNAASRYLRRGDKVVVVDDLSRLGAYENLEWLKSQGLLTFLKVDVRDEHRVTQAFQEHRDAGLVLHLAAQVAVTTSITNPRDDFEVNAWGTFNVLEGIRRAGISAPLIYASTNKVYGELNGIGTVDGTSRYSHADLPYGVAETQDLDFHSPYACSKGAADEYVREYHRIYGVRSVVFRQSCVYGYRQFGTEDQGWIAWFMIAARQGRPITVYGDGKQVRDVLFIDDLLDAFDAAANVPIAAGRAYNIGGGPDNVVSVLDILAYLERREGRPVPYQLEGWRFGDPKVYISDIRRARRELGWTPKIGWQRGLDLLYEWVSSNQELFR